MAGATARRRCILALALALNVGSLVDARAQDAGPTILHQTPPDDLYRRRGYGTGGFVFGGSGQGDLDQAGACADLSFARPRTCGARGGYGVYGNGLGYGFGN